MHDKSIMPFGKHKGKHLDQVPAAYLLWLFDNNKCGKRLRAYIHKNMNLLRQGK